MYISPYKRNVSIVFFININEDIHTDMRIECFIHYIDLSVYILLSPGFINSILSWNGWLPLSRLSFGAYLTHMTVMNFEIFGKEYNTIYTTDILVRFVILWAKNVIQNTQMTSLFVFGRFLAKTL